MARVGSAAHPGLSGLLRDEVSELARAVDLFKTGPRPLPLASALEDLGRAFVKRRRKEEAVGALGQALEIYADTGASWDARRVRGRLRKLGVRRNLGAISGPTLAGAL